MEPRLVGLKLILDALGIDDEVSSLQDRMRVQKAIYLAQVAGLDLGYRYGWYIHGPYSPRLTRDYFALAEEPSADAVTHVELRPAVTAQINKVRPILSVPTGARLTDVEWLEALASVHYLINVSRKSVADAQAVIEKKKAHLLHTFGTAVDVLRSNHLLDVAV